MKIETMLCRLDINISMCTVIDKSMVLTSTWWDVRLEGEVIKHTYAMTVKEFATKVDSFKINDTRGVLKELRNYPQVKFSDE